MGVNEDTFYDPRRVAIPPMGFCFPGTGRSGDNPPQTGVCSGVARIRSGSFEQSPPMRQPSSRPMGGTFLGTLLIAGRIGSSSPQVFVEQGDRTLLR